MIQLNLLPDVKLEYIKAQRSRRLITSISLLVTAVGISLLAILLIQSGLQKKHLSDLNDDIKSNSKKLKAKPQIDRILTVQNQLESLTALHNGKPAAPRLFEYLNQVTPAEVDITSINIDFTARTVNLVGTADSLSNVNKYIDTLKFTTYKTGEPETNASDDKNDKGKPAFSNIVLSSFSLAQVENNVTPPASFNLTLAYDETIFDITETVRLTVPKQVTTRSELNQPTDLFKAAPSTDTTTGGRN